jgi:hypothetical protein
LSLLIAESSLSLFKRNQGPVLEKVFETQRLDILLHARRDIPLISPESVARQLVFKCFKDILHFTQFLATTRCGTKSKVMVWLVMLVYNAMQEKYYLLGEICNIAAGLG